MFDVNFEQYKVFYFVAKNLSFSKASKELFISQSAVSQSIKNLETRLGLNLFVRGSKSISLTTSGETLYENVKVGFSYILNGENSVKSDSAKKELKIGASDTISKYFLLPYIESFCKLYPNVKIQIINKFSAESIELLKNSSVDIAFVSSQEFYDEKMLKFTKIKPIHDVFIAGPMFSHLKNQELSLQDLEQFSILALEKGTSTRKNLENLCKEYKLELYPEIEMQSMGLLKDFARIGLGISYISDLSLSKTTDLFALNIKEKLPTKYIELVTPKKIKVLEQAQNFIDLILD